MADNAFTPFPQTIQASELPEKFTFPFAYEPHELTLLAAKALQEKLKNHYTASDEWGKMYGVLVVQNTKNEIGFLMAFSGQVEKHAQELRFVPSIHNRLDKSGFFKKEEEQITALNNKITQIENNSRYKKLLAELEQIKKKAAGAIAEKKVIKDELKAARRAERQAAEKLNYSNSEKLQKQLNHQSITQHYDYKKANEAWNKEVGKIQSKLSVFENDLNRLKKERKSRSNALQKQLFDQYQFLNADGQLKSLLQIFDENKPPAGAGDCAAPKLLQYAFQNNYKPLAMGEFWWGNPPKSQLRTEGRFYPACAGKCKPILGHMLQGLPLEDDPVWNYTAANKHIDIVYEDEHLLVINKPAGLLSIPSKLIDDAVSVRMSNLYPEATGPLVAHRLDKLTSGLMIITKSLEVYREVQQQFINKTIKKSYLALLEGIISPSKGSINLPLSVDEFNRPMQMVNYNKGKKSETLYELLKQVENRSLVKFTPITGRTHQLRVHAAHPEGLNAPIVGDTLYGKKDKRLMLHAAAITFKHPITQEELSFDVPADFENGF